MTSADDDQPRSDQEMLALMREREARRGQWGPAMAALTATVVIVAVLILIAARQV